MNVCKWGMSGSATANSILLSVLLRLNIIYNQFTIQWEIVNYYCTINVELGETLVSEHKNVGLYILGGGGRGSEKVYCLYTCGNVDICG